MKRLLSIIAISAITFSATAQEKRQTPKGKPGIEHGKHKGHKGPDRQMMKEMNFSEAQRSQMKANREEYKSKLQQLKQDQNITLKDYNAKKDALNKEQRAKMQSMLTPEQKTKMADMKAKREQEKIDRSNKHFEKMKTELALTDKQSVELKAQNEAVRKNLKSIRENESMSKDEKMKQMKAIKDASQEKRNSILTADQRKKMEEMKAKKPQKDWKKGNN